MIFVVKNVYQPELHVKHDYTGPLIDFLQDKFPDGFEGQSRIYVNGDVLPVEHYDAEVTEADQVVLLTSVPAEPISTTTWIYIALFVVSTALTILLAPKPPKATGKRGRTFEIGSGQNVPALGSVVAEHFGQTWFSPDVASQPYSVYQGNQQFVNQILLLGAGKFRLDNIRVGNTDLAQLPPNLVRYQLFLPADHKAQYGQIQSQFGVYEDVVTSADVQGLDFSRNAINSFAGNSSPTNALKGTEPVTGFAVGNVMTLIGQPGWAMHRSVKAITTINGNFMGFASTVSDDHVYQAVRDDSSWRGWFNACPATKTIDRIELDFEFPQGLVYTETDGDLRNRTAWIDAEIQGINDDNTDNGPVIARQFVYTARTRDPVRKTESIAVPAGRYKVRCRRNDSDDVVTQQSSKCFWNGMKAFCINVPGSLAYGDVTLLAITMQASEALSSISDRITVQATRILPTVASDFAAEAPTVNPIDAFAQVVRESDPLGVDMVKAQALATRWAATNGFNFRFDDRGTVFDAIQTIGYSHRSQPNAYARQLSLRPDEARPFDQFLVSQEQMVDGSYKCGVNIGPVDPLVDGFRVKYQDPTSTTDLYVVWPSTALTPQDVSLDGCTNQATALAQAQYLWAKKSAVRRVVDFETEWDGLLYSVGDRISVLSNVLDVVQTCRVLSVSGNVLTVDGVLDLPALNVIVRDQYGAPSALLNGSMTGNQLTLQSLPPFPIFGINTGQEATTVVLGQAVSFTRSYTVQFVSPGDSAVTISAMSYAPEAYLYPIPGEVLP